MSYTSFAIIITKIKPDVLIAYWDYNIQNLRVMSESVATFSTEQIDFFPGALDIILLVVALVSTLSTFCSMQFLY
jgi:hypothetical protein